MLYQGMNHSTNLLPPYTNWKFLFQCGLDLYTWWWFSSKTLLILCFFLQILRAVLFLFCVKWLALYCYVSSFCFCFNWSIAALQCWVIFHIWQSISTIGIHVSLLSWTSTAPNSPSYPSRSSQRSELRFLCWITGSH